MAHIERGDGKLSTKKFVGDRIRIREGKRQNYRRAYEFDASAIREVIGIDDERLRVEGPPHLIWPADAELAWNTPAERREALLATGKHVK